MTKQALFMSTLVKLGTLYRSYYDKGWSPEGARKQALKDLNLPEDFNRDDYMLICDGQNPSDYGCTSAI